MMKRFSRHIATAALSLTAIIGASPLLSAQTDTRADTGTSSSSGIVRRNAAAVEAAKSAAATGVTERMQHRFETTQDVGDADRAWMRVIYRQLDLDKGANSALYYPVDIIDGEENLFRIIMRLLMDNRLAAYEYLDGREVFDDKYRIEVRDLLDKCYIAYTEARGSNARNPRFLADEADIPAAEVTRYYIIEKWEYDRRSNRLQSKVTAICPVLMRTGEYSSEPEPMPLFWVKYDDLRPHLMTRAVFLSDDNNLPTATYDDFFTLGRYNGEIYKTRNLRNLSMAQLYPDPEERKRAQDSIQASLDNFDSKLWVPSLDELTAAREAREAAETDSIAAASGEKEKVTPSRTRSRTAKAAAKKSKSKTKARKEPKPRKASSGTATRSVRNRRK